MKRAITISILSFILVFALSVFVIHAKAETLVGTNVDFRINLGLRVAPAELQRWLPAPWQLGSVPKGPLKGSNLYLLFMDRLLGQDPQGKPAAGGTFRAVALAVPAKNPQTGESAPFVIRIYVPHKDLSLYNPYKNSAHASIRREYSLKGADFEPGTGSELWELRDKAGGVLQFRMQYQRAVPRRAKQEMKPHSSVEPTFYRIYRIDQGSDLIKSVPAGIDRTQNLELRVTVSELSKLFDGTEQIIGIAVVPWYVREFFLP